jgi:hypothetical protein
MEPIYQIVSRNSLPVQVPPDKRTIQIIVGGG